MFLVFVCVLEFLSNACVLCEVFNKEWNRMPPLTLCMSPLLSLLFHIVTPILCD